MATYGGGTTFTISKSFVDFTANVSTVLYTCPADTYIEFMPLSVKFLSGSTGSPTTGHIYVQKDDGAGSFTTASSPFYIINLDTGTVGNAVSATVTDINTQTIRLVPGMRVVIIPGGSGSQTWRAVYSAVVFAPST